MPSQYSSRVFNLIFVGTSLILVSTSRGQPHMHFFISHAKYSSSPSLLASTRYQHGFFTVRVDSPDDEVPNKVSATADLDLIGERSRLFLVA